MAHRCTHRFPLPSWMGEDQDEPCRCDLPWGHEGAHSCSHLRASGQPFTHSTARRRLVRPWDSWAEDDPRYRQLGCLFTIVVDLVAWAAMAAFVRACLRRGAHRSHDAATR